MIEIMSPNIYNNLINNWEESIKLFRHNNHTDSISVVMLMDSYGMLISEVCSVKLIYFDTLKKEVFIIDATDVLPFIEEMANRINKSLNFNERVDILLNIICKKDGVPYLSDLHNMNMDNSILSFIDKERFMAEYNYIVRYLKKSSDV